MVDAAVHIAFLRRLDGALVPRPGASDVTERLQAVADLVEVPSQAVVVDAAVHIAFLCRLDGALVPRPGASEVAELL